MSNTNNQDSMPDEVYINRKTKQQKGANYPNVETYVRKDKEQRLYMDDMSFIGHYPKIQ